MFSFQVFQFMSMDVVVNDKINGEEKATWERVTDAPF